MGMVLVDAKVLLNKWDISGQLNAVFLEHGADILDATSFGGQGFKEAEGGLTVSSLRCEGFWRGGTGQIDEVLFGQIGVVDVPVTAAPSGAEGDTAFFMRAVAAEYAPGAAMGELLRFSATAQESGGDGLVRGRVLAVGSKSVSGAGASQQMGAVAVGQRAFAVVHVMALTGTLNMKIESDSVSGMTSPLDRIVFPQFSAPGAVYATPVPGAITDDWWRAAWTLSIGGSATVFVVFGIR